MFVHLHFHALCWRSASIWGVCSGWILLALLISCETTAQQEPQADSRPNILLILADDLGYADLGCYGGDIATPHIDGLAKQGIRFSRFHTSPFCAPTRAMLLSGNDNHIAGIGRQGYSSEVFGYEGQLTQRVALIPEVLKGAGYHSYMAGKWHLGNTPETDPHARGFERSFALLEAGASHYSDQGLFSRHPKAPFTENGQPAQWPKGAYSTDFYTDKLIEFIKAGQQDGQPFFAYAAYTSPHWPLQVDTAFSHKYRGRYDEGYEVLRRHRLASLTQAGMIPPGIELPELNSRVKPWASLSPAEQRKEAHKMEIYAGMVDNLDTNIGRLLQALKEMGIYEETLIVFMSDNGAAAEDFYSHPVLGPFLQDHFTDSGATMGLAGSFISYGPQWAEAGSAPFKYFKGYTTEGGVLAPLIIAGPGITHQGEIHHGFLSLLDLAPTFYEVAGTSYPTEVDGNQIFPLKGNTFLAYLQGLQDSIHTAQDVFALEHEGAALLRKGDWKLTNIRRPFAIDHFTLHHIPTDLGEGIDLKVQAPDKYQELLGAWQQFADEIKLDPAVSRAGGHD